jgi:hypothetical protein
VSSSHYPSSSKSSKCSKEAGCHCKTKKPLEDLAAEGMTVEEFWQHGDKNYTEFEYEKSLDPKHIHLKFLWIMQIFQMWYFLECVYELNFVEAKFFEDIFNTLDISKCATSLW